MMEHALALSPVHQGLVEKSVKGYQEIEFEVMRDKNDKAIAICDMENFDPVGIHTGDSIVFAPCQNLKSEQLSMLKASALKILKHLEIEGGCNIQFALKPGTMEYYLIEINPLQCQQIRLQFLQVYMLVLKLLEVQFFSLIQFLLLRNKQSHLK